MRPAGSTTVGLSAMAHLGGYELHRDVGIIALTCCTAPVSRLYTLVFAPRSDCPL